MININTREAILWLQRNLPLCILQYTYMYITLFSVVFSFTSCTVCRAQKFQKTHFITGFREERRTNTPLARCKVTPAQKIEQCLNKRTTRKQNTNVVLPVSHIWALIVFPSTWILLVANSTPMVDFDSKLNSFLVNRERRFDLPTPESPMRTTVETYDNG